MLQQKENFLKICEVLAEQENLRVTVKEASKGALIAGCGAFAGALLAGPVGLAVGGTVGSITAAWTCRGKFRPVIDVLRNDMTPQQQQKLVNAVGNVLSNIKPEDYVQLVTLVLTTASLKEAVLAEMGSFLLKELSLQMIR